MSYYAQNILSKILNSERLDSIKKYWALRVLEHSSGEGWNRDIKIKGTYSKYVDFCITHGEHPVKEKKFFKALQFNLIHGVSKKKNFDREGNEIITVPSLKQWRHEVASWLSIPDVELGLPTETTFENPNNSDYVDDGLVGSIIFVLFTTSIWIFIILGIIGLLVFGVKQLL